MLVCKGNVVGLMLVSTCSFFQTSLHITSSHKLLPMEKPKPNPLRANRPLPPKKTKKKNRKKGRTSHLASAWETNPTPPLASAAPPARSPARIARDTSGSWSCSPKRCKVSERHSAPAKAAASVARRSAASASASSCCASERWGGRGVGGQLWRLWAGY